MRTKKQTPKYPKVVVQLSGMDGNAVAIIARVQHQLRKQAKVTQSELDAFRRQATSGDYSSLLNVVEEWVHVI